MIIPVYDIDRLVRLARQQLRDADLPGDSLAVYALVAKLRRGELRAAVEKPTTPTPTDLPKETDREPTFAAQPAHRTPARQP